MDGRDPRGGKPRLSLAKLPDAPDPLAPPDPFAPPARSVVPAIVLLGLVLLSAIGAAAVWGWSALGQGPLADRRPAEKKIRPPEAVPAPARPARAQAEVELPLDPVLQGLAALLDSDDPQARRHAVETLRRQGAAATPALAAVLRGKRDEAAVQACIVLASLGPDARSAVPELIATLEHRSERVRAAAELALAALGDEALGQWTPGEKPRDDDLLSTAVGSPSRVRQVAALQTIRAIRPAVDRVLPALTETLASPHPEVRIAAAAALRETGVEAVGAVTRGPLRHEQPGVRLAAIDVLGDIGPAAAPATADLIERLADTHPTVRARAAWALGRIGPAGAAESVPPLLKLLDDTDALIRATAADSLAACGPVALPKLMETLTTTDEPSVREAAMRGLVRIGDLGVAPLVELLRHEKPQLRALAAATLGRMGPKAAAALDPLRIASDDPNIDVRFYARQAVARIEGKPHHVPPGEGPSKEGPLSKLLPPHEAKLPELDPASAPSDPKAPTKPSTTPVEK